MLRLILDRSGEQAAFALADEQDILCQQSWTGGYHSAPDWFAQMLNSLRGSGCALQDIAEFVCAIGPGSFSGIRSALATLEGLALPDEKPVSGISTASAIAFEFVLKEGRAVSVVGDARRSTLWLASFKFDKDCGLTLFNNSAVSQSDSDFQLVAPLDLAHLLPEDSLVVSPDFDRIGDLLQGSCNSERLVSDKVAPDITTYVVMATEYPGLCRREPLPVYLHPAVAG